MVDDDSLKAAEAVGTGRRHRREHRAPPQVLPFPGPEERGLRFPSERRWEISTVSPNGAGHGHLRWNKDSLCVDYGEAGNFLKMFSMDGLILERKGGKESERARKAQPVVLLIDVVAGSNSLAMTPKHKPQG